MASTTRRSATQLRTVANEVARQLQPLSAGTQLQVHRASKIVVEESDTDGQYAEIGELRKGRQKVGIGIWLDRFSGHDELKLNVCFYSDESKPVRSLARMASKQLFPVRQITDSDLNGAKYFALKQPLRLREFNAPIEEHYTSSGDHFFGFYDQTLDGSAVVSPQFVDRAVAFILDVVRSQSTATDADRDGEVYSRCEDRKLVKAHLRHERSGYLASECKRRDGYRCQICALHFEERYGIGLGAAFAEAHHIRPLGKQGDQVRTTLKDLITVCPNCHRMLHRMEGKPGDINKLKVVVRKHRQ